MATRPIDDVMRRDLLPRWARFVLVNERSPRANACCALCGARIEQGYARDPHTRLLYCDARCFVEHERMSMPATVHHARRVS